MSGLFDGLLQQVRARGKVGVSLVEASDVEALEAVFSAEREGFASPVLIGDSSKIREAADKAEINIENATLVDSATPEDSARLGVQLVRNGEAAILMKGKISTSTLLKAVLDRERGLRIGNILSHVACLEVPGFDRFLFVTDGGVIIDPDLEKKIEIVKNAVTVARMMGVQVPKIACLGPSEVPTPDSEASVHASILAKMGDRGVFGDAKVDGPMALDLAISLESARIKRVSGDVVGRADVLMAPDLVTANTLAKSMQYFAGSSMGGVIVGALAPIVVISRSDSSQVKLNSLAMARSLVGDERRGRPS